jgi:ankyrin repeat protein
MMGRTPLSWAAAREHEAVVQLLLDKGAVVGAKEDGNGRMTLSWGSGRVRGRGVAPTSLLQLRFLHSIPSHPTTPPPTIAFSSCKYPNLNSSLVLYFLCLIIYCPRLNNKTVDESPGLRALETFICGLKNLTLLRWK